jgi:hypothetical protein
MKPEAGILNGTVSWALFLGVGDLLVMVKPNGRNTGRPDLVYTWSVRWLHAQRDLSETKEQKMTAFVDHHKRMKELREQVKLLVGNGNSGLLPDSAVPESEWYLAEAELWLLKERGKVEKHIDRSYLKSVQAPQAVRPVLKAWMELN